MFLNIVYKPSLINLFDSQYIYLTKDLKGGYYLNIYIKKHIKQT